MHVICLICGVLLHYPTKNRMLFRFKFHHHPMTTIFDAFFCLFFAMSGWVELSGFGTTDKLSGPGNPNFAPR